ncbi:ribonuclease HII [Bdellovibrionota bacterium FG-2]
MQQKPTLEFETQAGFPARFIAGVDEAGRGCLAGPVVSASVVLPRVVSFETDPWLSYIKDSKKLSAEKREELFPKIQNWAGAWAVGMASPEEIDQLNIHYAAHLSMVRSVEGLGVKPDHILVDGKFVPKGFGPLGVSGTAIVKGDLRCLSIAAASILAKVSRDRLMVALEQEYPGYGFAVHKGYPTSVHVESLKRLGVTGIHRKTFGPVASLLV